jgi:transposase
MDLTDEQWAVLEPVLGTMPQRADGRGRPWRDSRQVLNGIL